MSCTPFKRAYSPLLVAVLAVATPVRSQSTSQPGVHHVFTEISQQYVTDGLVDYEALCGDARFQPYLDALSATDPQTLPSGAARMAFWINAYNAFTLKIICDNYPVKSINDLHTGGLIVGTVLKKTIWHKKFFEINGERMSLDHIEHKILRKNFNDPRIHFAVVCASLGCAPLRAEAYEAERLDEQLDDQARVFLSQTEKNSFDTEKRVASLSKVFDWFSGDFGKNNTERLLYLTRYLPPDIADAIKADPDAWKIKHTHWDWNLNDTASLSARN